MSTYTADVSGINENEEISIGIMFILFAFEEKKITILSTQKFMFNFKSVN